MSVEENRVLLRRFVEAWNRKDPAAFDELVGEDYVSHTPGHGVAGRVALKQMVEMIRTGLPDFRFTVDDVIAEGDKVVTRLTCRGTHKGELHGVPATGRAVSWQEISIDRVAGGKIVENWSVEDSLGLMQQLGALTASAAPGGH